MANKSKRFRLNWRDLIEGFVMAALAGGLASLYNQFDTGADLFAKATVVLACKASVGAGILWLLRNFFMGERRKKPDTNNPLKPY